MPARRAIMILTLLLLAGNTLLANHFNTPEWWGRLVYETKPSVNNFSAIDSSIIVVTNRALTNDKLRFVSETTGDGKLLYFFVYAYKGKWRVLQAGNLEEAINYTPQKNNNWVVYTEGMGKIFTSELYRGMMMSSQYGVNVIMLDYPSITTTKRMYGNYKFSIHNAKEAYRYHRPVLENIKDLRLAGKLGQGKLSLFFHSMGNYLLRETFVHKKYERLNDIQWVDNLVLNAPCVPAKGHADWLSKVRFAKRIYVHYNPEDRVLRGASLAAFATQLGNDPGYPIVTKARYINFNKVVDDGHSYFLTLQGREPAQAETLRHYRIILHGDAALLNSRYYTVSSHEKIGVDVLPL